MNAVFETKQLRTFLAVADTLHFGRAARKLAVAQPNLSQQIARLESLVGSPLFVRAATGTRLTPAGEFLKQRARVLLANLESTLETTRKLGSGDAGSITVGFCGSVMLTSAADLISGFRASHPRVGLELRELHVNEQIRMLQDGVLDVCFVRDCGDPADVAMVPLLGEPYVAVLPDRHALARRRRLDPALLRNEPFILFSPEMAGGAYEQTLSLCANHGFRPNVQREAAQWTSLATLIATGLGVSIAPASVAKVLVPGVSCVPLASKCRSFVQIAYATHASNPAAAKLVEHARAFRM